MFAQFTKVVTKTSLQEKYFLILIVIFLLASIPLTVYISTQVRDLRSQAATTLNRQVSASSDDASQDDDGRNFNSTLSYLRVESDDEDDERRNVGIRFTNINIPRGSTINSASVEIYVDDDNDANLDFFAHRVDNAPSFSSSPGLDVTSRTTPSASTAWVQSNLGSGWKTSPSIRPVIQEIVNRSGWSSGNAMAILLKGKNSGSAEVTFRSWDYSGHTFGAKLHVTYTPPPPPAPPTVTFSASRTTITRGESTTLRWSTSRATSVSISSIGSVSLSGSKSVRPSSTITYTLTARGAGGTTKKSVKITVRSPSSVPYVPPVVTVPPNFIPKPPPKGDSSVTALLIQIKPLSELVGGLGVKVTVERTKFSQDLQVTSSTAEIRLKVSRGLLKQNKSYTLKITGQKLLTKKVKFKTRSYKPAIKAGGLYLGDLNSDNVINQGDVELLMADFSENKIADLNFDGLVNSIDYSILLKNLGKRGN